MNALLAIAAPALLAVACGPSDSGGETAECACDESAELSWEETKAAILACDPVLVCQAHSLDVTIKLADGRTCSGTEPAIDDVLKFLADSGVGDEIGYCTE